MSPLLVKFIAVIVCLIFLVIAIGGLRLAYIFASTAFGARIQQLLSYLKPRSWDDLTWRAFIAGKRLRDRLWP